MKNLSDLKSPFPWLDVADPGLDELVPRNAETASLLQSLVSADGEE